MKKKLKKISGILSYIITLFPYIKTLIGIAALNVISWLILKNKVLIAVVTIDVLVVLIIGCIYFYRLNLRKTFLKDGLPFLKGRGVKSKRIQDSSIRDSLFLKNKVFWAVVPNKDLSIIHLASINCLKYLMRNGFDVYVLVYDLHYFGRRKNEDGVTNISSIEKEVNHCIKLFKQYGLNNSILSTAKVTYKFESKSMHKQYHRNYSKVSAEIKLNELEDISRKKLTKKSRPVIRFLKPISIIAYLISLEENAFSANIAMTLSGNDENPLYDKCHKIMRNINSNGYVPSSIYIPEFSGFTVKDTKLPGVLDSAYCLTIENKEAIKEMAKNYKYDLKNPSDSVLFLINHLLFDYSDDSTFKPQCVKNNNSMKIDNFINTCAGGTCPDLPSCVIEGVYSKYLTTLDANIT